MLLLDEPVAALGPALRHETPEMLGRLRKDRALAVLTVSHHPDDARHIAERIAFAHGGRLLELAETARVLGDVRSPELRAYLGAPSGERAKPRERASSVHPIAVDLLRVDFDPHSGCRGDLNGAVPKHHAAVEKIVRVVDARDLAPELGGRRRHRNDA